MEMEARSSRVPGDGKSTYGDQYVFNDWLARGGSIEAALADAKIDSGILDLWAGKGFGSCLGGDRVY